MHYNYEKIAERFSRFPSAAGGFAHNPKLLEVIFWQSAW